VKKKIKTILFLGTSLIQQKSIIAAKKNGFKIIGVDKNKNSTSKKYCNYFINTSCDNVNYIFNKVKKIKNLNIIDIWANNDILLKSKYELEKKLKIKSDLKISSILNLLHKNKFKKFFKKYFINNSKKQYPILAKPILGHGSLGIQILKDQKDFLKIKNKKNYIFEKYIDNLKEYGVNFFYDKKKIYILNSVYRYFDHNITFAPLGTVAIKSNDKIINFLNKIKKEIYKLKLYGKIKLDIGIYNKSLKIIEISPRFHGEIDTAFLFSMNNNSLSDFYFSKLSSNKKVLINRKNKFLYGYFACYKKKSLAILKKIFKKNNIKFIKLLKRDNYNYEKIEHNQFSTNNIWAYAFYKTNKIISDDKFKKISHQINSFEI
jgi:predicted ATP-grasp superfamily ATP-dependent carboligase